MPALVVMGVVLASGLALAGFRAIRPGVLPGATIAGVDVGGLDDPELTQAITELGGQREERLLQVQQDGATVVSTAAEVGYRLDVDASVAALLHRGRQGNPIAALRDHVSATVGELPVPPVEAFDEATFASWVDRIADELGLQPVTGDIRVVGTDIEVLPPEGGTTIDVDGLRRAVLDALPDPSVAHITVPTTTTVPDTDPDRIATLVAQIRQAISAPVTLSHQDVAITFTPTQIGQLLEVVAQPISGRASGQDGNAELVLAVDPDSVTASISAAQFQGLNHEPRDATFAVSEAGVELVEAVDGFRYDSGMAAHQLLEVAMDDGPRTAELAGRTTPPAVSTEEVRDLGITEQVATFTTEHPCCQGRVTNIQRMADLIRGTVVDPGETFSLNAATGPRTRDQGFVDGGAISGGEFVEEIGGGVSQFTTTLFNAIFFGGYAIDEFRPHSYYISRYPVGREATLNYDPPIDLKFTNDSPHAIYIHTGYTDTSITVSLFSTEWARVETTTGPRYGFREPEEQIEETDELPTGEERVVQSGREGFSVDFTRELFYVDGRHETEHYTTYYLPEPRIVEVGTGTEEEPTEETPEPTEEPEPTAAETIPPPRPTSPPPPPPPPTEPAEPPATDPPPDPAG